MINSESSNAFDDSDVEEDALLGNINLCDTNVGHELIQSHSIWNSSNGDAMICNNDMSAYVKPQKTEMQILCLMVHLIVQVFWITSKF